MRKTSADVLNDADRTQRIMDWVIFKTEQDARLWSGLEMEGRQWVPGMPIYDHPDYRQHGQVVRPFFTLFDVNGGLDTADYTKFHRPRCEDCLVSWYGDEPCWVCGQDIEGETYKRFDKENIAGFPVMTVDIEYESFTDMLRLIRQDMSEHIERAMRRTAESVSQLGDELRRIYVGFDNDLMVAVTSPARGVWLIDAHVEANSSIALGGARRALRGPQPPSLVVGSTFSLEGLRMDPPASRFWLNEVSASDLTLCDEGFEVPEAVPTPMVPVMGTPFDGSSLFEGRSGPDIGRLGRFGRRRDGDHGRR